MPTCSRCGRPTHGQCRDNHCGFCHGQATAECLAIYVARLTAEIAALREAASAPVVHLAAGQVAVWPWGEPNDGRRSAYASTSGLLVWLGASASEWVVDPHDSSRTRRSGGACSLEDAQRFALAAVCELAREESDGL